MAQGKERQQHKKVLIPIKIDNGEERKKRDTILSKLPPQSVLDFTGWQTHNSTYQQLFSILLEQVLASE